MVKRRSVFKYSSEQLSINKEDVAEEEYVPEFITKGDIEFMVEKSKDSNGDDVIILKSDTEIIDIPLSVLRKKLLSLFNVRDTKLSDLSKIHKSELQNITSIMSGLYNTNCYNEIIVLINEVFSKGGDSIKPGTVYAYFYGCKMQTNFSPFSCSPLCSGSVQPVDMGNGWNVCDNYTIIFDSNESKFTILNNPLNKEDAYIFISLNLNFKGFNEKEHRTLENLGIHRIKIVYYDENMATNTKMTVEDFTPITNFLISSNIIIPVVENNKNEKSTSVFFWVFIILLILLFVAFLIYFLVGYSKGKSPRMENTFYNDIENMNYRKTPISDILS